MQAPGQIIEIPEISEIKTGAFIVPDGKYAKVKVLNATDAPFTVDGVIAEELTQFTAIRTSGVTANLSSAIPTTIDSSIWRCKLTYVCSPTVRAQVIINSLTTTSASQQFSKLIQQGGHQNSTVVEGHDIAPSGAGSRASFTAEHFELAGGAQFVIVNSTSFVIMPVYSYNFTAFRVRNGAMYEGKVPAGTVLDGDRYHIEIYAEPIANFPEDLKL